MKAGPSIVRFFEMAKIIVIIHCGQSQVSSLRRRIGSRADAGPLLTAAMTIEPRRGSSALDAPATVCI